MGVLPAYGDVRGGAWCVRRLGGSAARAGTHARARAKPYACCLCSPISSVMSLEIFGVACAGLASLATVIFFAALRRAERQRGGSFSPCVRTTRKWRRTDGWGGGGPQKTEPRAKGGR